MFLYSRQSVKQSSRESICWPVIYIEKVKCWDSSGKLNLLPLFSFSTSHTGKFPHYAFGGCVCLCLGGVSSSFGELHSWTLFTVWLQRNRIDMFPSTDWSFRAELLRNSLSTQLDHRAIGNVQLWLPITFHILTLSPHLFFSYFLAEVEWLSSWVPMPGHYLKPGGIWASLELHEMQQDGETAWGICSPGFVHCSFSVSLSLSQFFCFLLLVQDFCRKTYFTNR